jgi:hypothetical protein
MIVAAWQRYEIVIAAQCNSDVDAVCAQPLSLIRKFFCSTAFFAKLGR